MRQILTDILGPVGWERKILAFLIGAGVLGLTGPFGTYEIMGLSERLVFWLIVFACVGFFMHVFMITALRSRVLSGLPWMVRVGVGAVLAGLPGAAVVIFVHGVFRPPLSSAETLPVLWLQVGLIGWVVGILEFHDFGRQSAEAPAPLRTTFQKRLPPDVGDDIVSISMQDHYAEVTTTLGSHMILMRLSDAMAELDGVPGVQLHRSHYAMESHMVRLHRKGGRLFVELSDGRDLPVSASHVAAVREVLSSRADAAY